LTLTGSGFNDSSTVLLLNGWVSWSPTIVSRTPTTLVVSIEPEMVPNHGTAVQISVGNPYPWGGSSAPISVDVLNPVPTIGAVYPGALLAATYNNIAITGTNINSTTEVRINGSTAGVTISTSSPDGIIVEIAPNVIPSAGGVATVSLYNPPPGGGNSNSFQLTISTPQITLSSAGSERVGRRYHAVAHSDRNGIHAVGRGACERGRHRIDDHGEERDVYRCHRRRFGRS
jgi:hypothetical protein